MHFTDTHCHFDAPALQPDQQAVLAQCAQRGVWRILVPGTERSQWRALIQLCEQHPELSCGIGMHPCFEPQLDHLDDLVALLDHPQVKVLGEIGLHGPLGQLEQQQTLLEAQLELAQAYQLPVVLHLVQAHQAMLASLRRVPPPQGGVVHAFAGSLELAKTYHEQFGLKLGVGGIITYARAQKTRHAIAHIDASALVLETDAPDMPLSGFQGMRNSPLQIPNVFRALCQLRGITSTRARVAFAEQLEENANALWMP